MRFACWFIAVAAVAGVCWLFPLFHVVRQKQAGQDKSAGAFDATRFAETLWTNQLPSSLGMAVDAKILLPAIQTDAAVAKMKFARSVGLGGSYFYFVSGTGTVVAVSEDVISLAVSGNSTNAEITLQTGLVFGDAIRDGTGLLNVNDYPNSQDFNAISAALDHIVETRVLPKLRERAKVGAKISFAGCAEVDDEPADLNPLKIVPIQADVQ